MRILSFDVGTRNLAVCLLQTSPLAVLHWEVIDVQTEGGLTATQFKTIDGKKRALLQALCRRRGALDAALQAGDHVVIEQQPFGRGTGSPTMNILAHVIGAFYLLNDVNATPAFAVRQVAAKTKLCVSPEDWGAEPLPGEKPPPPPPKKKARCAGGGAEGGARDRAGEYDRYKYNKRRGVDICAAILEAREELAPWRAMFSQSAKRDDLADSLLQALSQVPATAGA